MSSNPLKKLEAFGQSIWLDYIKRDMLKNGELKKLITEDGLSGMTSNPSLFQNAITKSHDYDNDIKKLKNAGKTVTEIYETLTIQDVQDAADVFKPTYDEVKAKDGYVSLEVNPHLAHDTKGTVEEARRLWKSLNRPNVFIKVPATKEGLSAIEQLTSEGINVNVTLLFGLPRYREVANAYIAGIKKRIDQGQPVDKIASVASFFLSRIDVLIDPIIDKCNHTDELVGQIAIASAKVAYQMYDEIFQSEDFKKLIAKGAVPQRLLWASTGTKNPNYSDIKYVEPLIGANTVNTLPRETLEAYRDHGNPQATLARDAQKAKDQLELLKKIGINLDQLTQKLENEGVDKFNKSYDELIAALEKSVSKVEG